MTESNDDLDAPRTSETSSADKLALISAQRSALKQVIKISLSISKMQQGLQAAQLLGKSTSEIPSNYLKKFDTLKTGISDQPNNKLEQSLEILDKYINSALDKVFDIVNQGEKSLSENDSSSITLDDINNSIHQELDDFRRKSQTAVVIRLLLRERGIKTQGLVFGIPQDDIASKLFSLNKKEKEYRKTIQKEINTMSKYVNNVLADPELPNNIREEMQATKDSLQKNLEYLLAGKRLENMPIVFEMIEISSGAKDQEDDKQAPEPGNDIEPSEAASTKKEKRGFFSRASEWINTPTKVKWKDIDKYK